MPHPIDVICTVLRNRLNGEAIDCGLIAALERGGIDDRKLVAVASRHKITPAFAACLSDLGLDDRLPPELREYFALMRASNAARNRALHEQLGEIVSRLNGLGVEPCLLKGATRLIDGLYPDPSWRFMIDLDVLVPENQLQKCVNALYEDGYHVEPGARYREFGKHYPPLLGVQKPAAVEIHVNITEEQGRFLIPCHELINNSLIQQSAIGRIRWLKPEYQIIHLIAHHAILHNSRFYHILSISDAIELNLLIKQNNARLDWALILDKFARPEWRRACLASLQAARIIAGAQIPKEIAPNLPTRLHVMRLLDQERFRSARVAGLTFGWITHGLYRLSQPDKRDFFVRAATNPRPYLRVLRSHLKR